MTPKKKKFTLSGGSRIRRMGLEKRLSLDREIEKRRNKILSERQDITDEYKATGCPRVGLLAVGTECEVPYRRYRKALDKNNAAMDRLREFSAKLLQSYEPTYKKLQEDD